MEAAAAFSSSSFSRPLLKFPANTKCNQISTTRNRVINVPTHQFSISKQKLEYYSCCTVIRRNEKRNRSRIYVSAVEGTDIAPAEVTWQIIVGAIAGITPFVVAGIEFSKRIIAQRRCEVCGGSGLVLEDNDYFRCPGCGGFLPWQSWKKFFSG